MANADVVFPALGGVYAALSPVAEALLRVTAGLILVLGLRRRFRSFARSRHEPQSSMIATARVHPADAFSIFTGKHATLKPWSGSASRLESFSMWQ